MISSAAAMTFTRPAPTNRVVRCEFWTVSAVSIELAAKMTTKPVISSRPAVIRLSTEAVMTAPGRSSAGRMPS